MGNFSKKGLARIKSSRKARTLAQKQQLHALHAQRRGKFSEDADRNKENCPPQPADYQKRFYNETKKVKRRDSQIQISAEKITSLTETSEDVFDQVKALRQSEHYLQEDLNMAKGKIMDLKKKNHALTMKVSRIEGQQERAVVLAQEAALTFKFKEKGVITNNSRDMITRLIHEGVGTEKINNVVNIVAEAMGGHVGDSIHPHSATRIVTEAGVAAKIQVIQAVQESIGRVLLYFLSGTV